VVRHLESAKVQTRMLFGGNLARQPAYLNLPPREGGQPALRTVGPLAGADRLMKDAFFVGVYPGLGDAQIDYVLEVFHDFAKRRRTLGLV
jgi:CDP-6-deoxy-D-xylo-4-hexulose-3-dehydrase